MKKLYLLAAMTCFICLTAKSQQTFQMEVGRSDTTTLRNIAVAANKDILVCGSFHSGREILVTRINENGKKIWSKSYMKGAFARIAETKDNGFIMYGLDSQAVIIKCDSKGNVQWAKSIHSSSILFQGKGFVCQSEDDGFFLANADYHFHHQVIKVDSVGNLSWNKAFSSSGADYSPYPGSLTPLKDSGVLLSMHEPGCEASCTYLRLQRFDKTGTITNYNISTPREYKSLSPLVIVQKPNKIVGLFHLEKSGTPYFSYATIDLESRKMENILFNNKGNINKSWPFVIQTFARINHLVDIKQVALENFVIRNDYALFSSNLLADYIEMKQYDSLGRLCPDFREQVKNANTSSVEFLLPGSSYFPVSNPITLEDVAILSQDENVDSIICSGKAPDLIAASEINKDQISSAVKLYPNPATKFITLQYESEKSQAVQIKISNASGVLVKGIRDIFSAGQNTKTINVESLYSGVYFLKLQTEAGEKDFQFLKE